MPRGAGKRPRPGDARTAGPFRKEAMMSVCIEITCIDVEVSSRTRRLVLAHAQVLRDFADLFEVCHVIIRKRGGGSRRGFAVSIDLIRRDGRALPACLRDRQVYFESLETAIDEAFHELRCWLLDMAPTWRRKPSATPGWGCACEPEPIDHPDDLFEPQIAVPALAGTHHFVG